MNYNKIKYKKAPLPFNGQKRKFLRAFVEALAPVDRATPIYDVFGGSGLLANACLEMGFTDVTYNDFDGYLDRIEGIPFTNTVIQEIQGELSAYARGQRVSRESQRRIMETIQAFDTVEPVDCITLSSRLLFSANYAWTVDALNKATFYAPASPMSLYNADGYLEGAKVVRCDYRKLLERADGDGIIVLDPPYLTTDVAHYGKQEYWNFTEYLDLIYSVQGRRFIYFTSDKSQLIELLEYFDRAGFAYSPFRSAKVLSMRNTLNKDAAYTDLMYVRI